MRTLYTRADVRVQRELVWGLALPLLSLQRVSNGYAMKEVFGVEAETPVRGLLSVIYPLAATDRCLPHLHNGQRVYTAIN